MKVNKVGDRVDEIRNANTSWSHKTTCGEVDGYPGCGSELEVTLADVYKIEADTPMGKATRFCVKCAMCGSQNPIPYAQVPNHESIPNQKKWLVQARTALIHKLKYESTDWDRIKNDLLLDGIPNEVFEDLKL